MNKGFLIILMVSIVTIGLILSLPARAQEPFNLMNGVSGDCKYDQDGVFESCTGGCRGDGDCTFCDILRVVYNVGKFVFISVAGVSLVLIMWHAVGLIMNFGNAEKVAAAKKGITNTLLAIVIIMLSWTLVDAIAIGVMEVDMGPFRNDVDGTNSWAQDYNWWEGPTCIPKVKPTSK